ncbi:regulator of DNA class I crossover intermediates 1 [Cyrtonyx montezumae]|uniref:regulator of DNA class I crossover intermediates 1 n=1 Tax=Cyrtonyx montezumae TaxID=9017 RepID=UPI0032DB8FBD
MKLLGVSSPKSSAVSLDLLNLYVVNQISTKKDNTGNLKKPVHVEITEDIKAPFRRNNLELPRSPLRNQFTAHLDHIKNRLQEQVLDSRRQHLLEKEKFQYKLTQVTELTYAERMEHEDNTATTFSTCPLSPSIFWSSNCTQFSEESFNANLMDNPWEQTYEDKQKKQPGTISDQDPWLSDHSNQCIFRKSDTEPQELLKPLHRLDYMNSARKNPVITASKESENTQGVKEPLFGAMEETADLRAPQDEGDSPFLSLFGDESQPIYNKPSTKHFNPFANQNTAPMFLIDPDDRNQMTNRNYTHNTGEAHPAVNARKNAVDRHLKGIFTAPEQVLYKSNNAPFASYEENSLHKTHLQDCHEGQLCLISPGNTEKPSASETSEAYAYYHDQQINLKENMQHHSRNKRDEPVKESAWKQNQLFQLEEFAKAQQKEYNFGVSSSLHKMKQESPLSSPSPSYSPRQTESCFSSSPDMSEEEDIARKKKYVDKWCLQTDNTNLISASASTEPPRASHNGAVPPQPGSTVTVEGDSHLQQKHSISHTGEEKKEHAAPGEGSSLHQAQKSMQVTKSARYDVWVQTESSGPQAGKVDAATQCDPARVCSCGRSLPSALSLEGLYPPTTAGGHKTPEREALQPAGSSAGQPCSSEAEYLARADRATLGVLSHIDAMETEKQ